MDTEPDVKLWFKLHIHFHSYRELCCHVYHENPIQQSKTKHIDIRFHFIRDNFEKKLITLVKVHTNDQRANLFTKSFDVSCFSFLVKFLGLIDLP